MATANNEIRKDKLPYRMAGGIMALCYWFMAFPSIIEPPYEQSLWYRILQIVFHLVWGFGCYFVYADRYYAKGSKIGVEDYIDAVMYGVWMGLSTQLLFAIFYGLK